LKGLIKNDGDAAVFDDVEDTGIPALKRYCMELTKAPRVRRAKQILADLRDVTASVRLYLSAEGRAETTAESIRVCFDEQFEAVGEGLDKVCEELTAGNAELVDAGIVSRLEEGAKKAGKSAVGTIQEQITGVSSCRHCPSRA
jgi:hypothetical protein